LRESGGLVHAGVQNYGACGGGAEKGWRTCLHFIRSEYLLHPISCEIWDDLLPSELRPRVIQFVCQPLPGSVVLFLASYPLQAGGLMYDWGVGVFLGFFEIGGDADNI
jgi:hypothetical protein